MSVRKHRFFNTYLTATMSVALVLFLIGMECVIALCANTLLHQVKESTTLTVVVSDDMTQDDSARVARLLEVAPFCRSYEFVSKDVALTDHIISLGEDPTEFLGYNPIRASYEIKLASDYVVQDSLEMIEEIFRNYSFVEEVTYPRVVVDMFARHIGKVSLALLGVALVLMIISIVLIVNTIRLTVYSRRFIIHTMKLVGATPWMIKGPIVRKSMWMGFMASLLALALIAGLFAYVQYRFGFWIFPLVWQNIALVCGVTVVCGLILTFFASLFAVNKYIRLKADDLYYV